MSSGIAFHCHHDILVEYVWDYEDRKNFILTRKPEAERHLHLTFFKFIPPELLPPEVGRAMAEVDWARVEVAEAWAKWDRAEAELDEARARAKWTGDWAEWTGAWAKWEKARAELARARAWAEWVETSAELDRAIQVNYPALEELHTRLCPGCPWDGKTIFPEVKK